MGPCMSRTCTALFHENFEDLGSFAPVLRQRGWKVSLQDAPSSRDLASAAGDPDLLVILGGAMGVYEFDLHPFLQEEMALVSRRLRRDRPTLGICLGAQVMAAALGARSEERRVGEGG